MHTLNTKICFKLISIISVFRIFTVYGLCSILDSPNNCIEWNQCRENDNRETLSRLTLQQCWEQCRLRPQCKAIDYWRRKQSCDAIYTLTGELISPTRGPCVRIRKTIPVSPFCDGCSERTTCNAGVGTCSLTACSPLNVVNAVVYGNIGSQRKVVYDDAITITYPICQPNHMWALVLRTEIANSMKSIMFYDQPQTQEEATATCAAVGQSLIKMDSTEKFNIVVQFLEANPGYGGIDFWIQGKYTNGVWLFDDGGELRGDVVTFGGMNGGVYPCARLYFGHANGIRSIEDIECYAEYSFICET